MNKLTKKELADIMKVQPRTINNWINKGMPLWYTPGGHTRFDLEEVTTWCDNISKKRHLKKNHLMDMADVERKTYK